MKHGVHIASLRVQHLIQLDWWPLHKLRIDHTTNWSFFRTPMHRYKCLLLASILLIVSGFLLTGFALFSPLWQVRIAKSCWSFLVSTWRNFEVINMADVALRFRVGRKAVTIRQMLLFRLWRFPRATKHINTVSGGIAWSALPGTSESFHWIKLTRRNTGQVCISLFLKRNGVCLCVLVCAQPVS